MSRKDNFREIEEPMPGKSTVVAFATRILADEDPKFLQFCYLFPRDHCFYKDDIIQIWESVFLTEAESLFREFEKENIFELARFDPSTRRPMYKMNTLVVDHLEQHHDVDFIQINGAGSDIPEHSHYASICRAVDPIFLEKLYQAKALLTLLLLQGQEFLNNRVCRHLFKNLPLLVCLDLSHSEITDLPSSISKLHYLRYLNLSYTPIITLPNSLCDLSDLQTLKLRGCINLLGLPKAIRKLRSLRHLDVDVDCLLVSMPPGLGALRYLQTLPAFVVGRKNGHEIIELRNLIDLHGTICIFMLENISSSDEAKEAALDEKSNLEKLELNWQAKEAALDQNPNIDNLGLEDGIQVLENLRPHRNIKELQIVGYGGAKFPDWLGDPHFSVLKTITIHNSKQCKILPPLGKLPFLNSLHVSLMNEVKLMDHQFCSRNIDAETSKSTNDIKQFEAFPRLEKLTLNEMHELEKWIEVEDGDFPQLQRLNITACSKLETLPDLSLFKALQQLEITQCPSLKSFTAFTLPTSLGSLTFIDCELLNSLCHKYVAENQGKLTHISSIWIDDEQIVLMHRETSNEGELFEAFASRRDTTTKVMDALKNNHLSTVGVFGMPGVGKTFLMEEIMKQVRDEELFDQVVMVIVSQNPNIRRIQENMAKQLHLHLDEHMFGELSLRIAAAQLSDRLSQGEKVLIVLDDIWGRLDFEKVGIPNKSKVLFTTRSSFVCYQMETEETIEVGVLSENDSWELFRQKAGDVVYYPSHQEVAHDVLNVCKGLPFAIVTLGLALRSKKVILWHDAYTQLKKSIYNNGMGPATAVVKLSYEFLHGDKVAQMCFLYCLLFPEGFPIKINVLLSYLLGEKLLEDVDTVDEARQRLHVIVDKLMSSGILSKSKEGDIMMHDITRDRAIRIASDPKEGEGFIVKSGLGLKAWLPIDREMENCKRLSLMSNDLKFIPNFTASLLSILSLSQNKNLWEIPDDLFKEMKQLKTLDLSSTGISSLPPSIQCLQSLRTLLMDECFNLIDISLVGELQRLEILSFHDSKKVQIPVSMQKLANLIILNASNTKFPFPPKVISSLYRLEELYLRTGTVKDFSEVTFLAQLTCLEIHLPIECFLEDFPSHLTNLSRFSISVGRQMGLNGREHQLGAREMYLDLRSATQNPSIRIPNWVGTLVEKTQHLEVVGIDHLTTVAELNENWMYHSTLRVLSVWACMKLRHLLSTTSATTKARKPLFSNLEELRLSGLWNFISMYDGPIPEGFLFKLKKLKVTTCSTASILIPFDLLGNLQKLEELFLVGCFGLEKVVKLEGSMSKQPPSLIFPCLRKISIDFCRKLKCVLPLKAARHLLQLEELKIWDCSVVKVIFEDDGGENANKDKLILPRLKTLELCSLPNLSKLGPPGLFFDFPALVKMEVVACKNWEMLPLLDAHSIPKLKKLMVDSGWLDQLKWDDESLKFHLKSLPGLVETRRRRWS